MYIFNIRPVILGDEFINIDRLRNGFLPAAIIDYSLRPLYRALNFFWTFLFSKNLDALLLGSLILFYTISAIISAFVWAKTKSLWLVSASLLMLLMSPEFLRVGLGATPQLYSGLFILLSVIFLLLKINAALKNDKNTIIYGVFSYVASCAALLSHPAALPIILLIPFADICSYLILKLNKKSAFSPDIFRSYILSSVLSFFILTLIILIVDRLYISYGGGLQGGIYGMTNEEPYSYLRIWHLIFTDPNPSYSNYQVQQTYYLEHLFLKYPIFSLIYILLFLFGIGKFLFNKNKQMDLIYFLPAFIFFALFLALSLKGFRAYYSLAALSPMAVFSAIYILIYLRPINSKKWSLLFIPVIAGIIIDHAYIKSKSVPYYQPFIYLLNTQSSQIYFLKGDTKQIACRRVAVALNINYSSVDLVGIHDLAENSILCVSRSGMQDLEVEEFLMKKGIAKIDDLRDTHIILFQKNF